MMYGPCRRCWLLLFDVNHTVLLRYATELPRRHWQLRVRRCHGVYRCCAFRCLRLAKAPRCCLSFQFQRFRYIFVWQVFCQNRRKPSPGKLSLQRACSHSFSCVVANFRFSSVLGQANQWRAEEETPDGSSAEVSLDLCNFRCLETGPTHSIDITGVRNGGWARLGHSMRCTGRMMRYW